MFPVCKFEHMGETFDPVSPVRADHPMVVARPDLFSDAAPAAKSPKKAST